MVARNPTAQQPPTSNIAGRISPLQRTPVLEPKLTAAHLQWHGRLDDAESQLRHPGPDSVAGRDKASHAAEDFDITAWFALEAPLVDGPTHVITECWYG